MKILKLVFLALVFLGFNFVHTGCERHDFETTKKLYDHGEEHGGGHGGGGGHDKPESGGDHKKESDHKKGEHDDEAGKEAEGGKKVF